MSPRTAERSDRAAWLAMREQLWPGDEEGHAAAIDRHLAGNLQEIDVAFLVLREARPVGFLELRLRPLADVSQGSPVPYVEGWFVEEPWRGQGLGAALMEAAEEWALARGFRELASDAELANEPSQAAHRALGFEEEARVVLYRKVLGAPGPGI